MIPVYFVAKWSVLTQAIHPDGFGLFYEKPPVSNTIFLMMLSSAVLVSPEFEGQTLILLGLGQLFHGSEQRPDVTQRSWAPCLPSEGWGVYLGDLSFFLGSCSLLKIWMVCIHSLSAAKACC